MNAHKEYGKLSKKQIKEVYAYFYQGQREAAEVSELFRDTTNEKVVRLLDATIPWAYFYEIPHVHLLSFYLLCVTSKAQLNRMRKSDDPHQAMLDWANSKPRAPRGFNKWTIEEGALFISLTKAVQFNLLSVQSFGIYLNEFIARARKGDDNALFNAILIDQSTICSLTASKRISRAVIQSDGEFFDHLAKAIKGTRPRKPQKKHDDLRVMTQVIDESIGINNLSRSKIYDLLVDDMQLYPVEGKDAMKGFEKFIERMLKNKADMKT